MSELKGMEFLKWLNQYRIPLLIVQVIALSLSVVFSSQHFMPKEYKSYTVMYPSNIADYSHESPMEQMIEFLNSVDIKNEVMEKFDLYKHYFNVAQNGKYSFEKLYHEYDRNVIISPTTYRAVELDVYDISPDTAYEMVNYIIEVLNKKLLQVQQEKAIEVATMWKTQLDLKQHQIDSMVNISKQLSEEYGLLGDGTQTREVLKAYYQGKGSTRANEITTQLKNLQEYELAFHLINDNIMAAMNDEHALRVEYDGAMKEVNKHYTYCNLVSTPYKADWYCYPLRTLIVLCSCIAALVFSIVFIRTAEKIKF